MAAAVATWIVARGPMITRVLRGGPGLGHDHAAAPAADLAGRASSPRPGGRACCRPAGPGAALHEELGRRWPDTAAPGYPALAGPGSARVGVPEWWRPGL